MISVKIQFGTFRTANLCNCKVVDAKGNLCPTATNELQFSVAGNGSFRAAANGDATNLEMYHQPHMHVFSGMLVANCTIKQNRLAN